MEKIKTLKDMDFSDSVEYSDETRAVKIELKREAIKWIKHLENDNNWEKFNWGQSLKIKDENTDKFMILDIIDYEQDDKSPIIEFINYFFNINKKNLK